MNQDSVGARRDSPGGLQASGLLTGDSSHPFDNHQFVRWCYLNYLRREPDGPGWSFWETELNNLGDYNASLGRSFVHKSTGSGSARTDKLRQ